MKKISRPSLELIMFSVNDVVAASGVSCATDTITGFDPIPVTCTVGTEDTGSSCFGRMVAVPIE